MLQPGDLRCAVGPSPIKRFRFDILKHHIEAGLRTQEANTCSHHASSENGDLFHLVVKASPEFFGLGPMEPEATNHAFGLTAHGQFCEESRLDLQPPVEPSGCRLPRHE